MTSELSDIFFDDQDANLFLVDDARLRADAIKHSVLPRLHVVMNSAIALIREIYGIEALDDSTVSVFPNFRQKRDNALKVKYEAAFVGLGGQRLPKWSGFSRTDGNPVQILPFRLAFVLTQGGVFMTLENGWVKGLDDQSFGKILRFYIENEDQINPLCFRARMRPAVRWGDDLSVLAPLREQCQFRIEHRDFKNHFYGQKYHFPVAKAQLKELVRNFASFFPVYDSQIQMAKGDPPRLGSLISKLSNWLQRDQGVDNETDGKDNAASSQAAKLAVASAETKIRVMPAIRWQVFQRDQWKCVACGRNSHDGAILHVDHILPRSRGGLDVLDNFQTLCNICNIGKSNRDSTNLRTKNGPSVCDF